MTTSDDAAGLLAAWLKVPESALEEFNELQQRHGFLEQQLEDVRATRRDLARVIKELKKIKGVVDVERVSEPEREG